MAPRATPPAGKALTPKSFAVWTAVMTLLMGGCVSGLVTHAGPIGPVRFTVGFVPMFLAVMALSWSGRLDRLLPAALATLLVAMWPAYRGFSAGEWAASKVFLFVAGGTDVFLLLFIGMDYVRRRGWVSDLSKSPVRRRLVIGSMFGQFFFHAIGWPAGVWQTGLSIAWVGVLAWAMLWPVRRPPSQPGQPVTA